MLHLVFINSAELDIVGVFLDFGLVFGGEVGVVEEVEGGDGEVEAGGVVLDEHVEGGGGAALFDEAVDGESLGVGVVGEDGVEGFGVAVEVG